VADEDGEITGGVMILGRPAQLWAAVLGGLFNIAVVFNLGGFAPTEIQIGVVNTVILAALALIANTDALTISAGREALRRQIVSGNATAAPGTPGSPGSQGGPGGPGGYGGQGGAGGTS